MSVAANTRWPSLARARRAFGLLDSRRRARRWRDDFVARLRHQDAVDRRAGRRRSPAATSRRSRSRAGWRPAPRVLILDEPTQGVDVGAKAEIHRLIVELAADGPGDPDDLVRAARGARHERPHRRDARRARSSARSTAPSATQERLMALALGARAAAEPAVARRRRGPAGYRRELVGGRRPSGAARCSSWRSRRRRSSARATCATCVVSAAPVLVAAVRHDAGDPRAADRHLDRLAVRDLRRRRRAAGQARAADARSSALGTHRSPAPALGAVNGVLVAGLGLPVDRRDAGHAGRLREALR